MANLDLSCYVPTFSIKIGGRPQPELERSVLSISVDDSIEKASMFNISLNEDPKLLTQNSGWLDSSILDPATDQEVEIYVGYANSPERSREPTILGVITDLKPSFPSSGIPSLNVSGYCHSFRLQRSVKRDEKTFDNERDLADIVKKIAIKHNLGEKYIESAFKPAETIAPDNESSDYKILDGLAKSVGYEFFVRGKNLYFRKPKDRDKVVRSLKWGRDMISFSPNMNTANVVSKVSVRSHNPSDPSNPIIGIATSEDLVFGETGASAAEFLRSNKELEITGKNVSSADEAKALAKSHLVRANNSFIEGTVECIGIPEIRAGTSIKIEGVGKRFSGKYYIKSAKHSLGVGGYTLFLNVRWGVGTV
jgi:phage protein D